MTKKINYQPPPFSVSTEIEICTGLMNDADALAGHLKGLGTKYAIITDNNVEKLYGNHLCDILNDKGLEVHVFSFPAGELSKSREVKEQLENQMFEQGLGRDTCFIPLGGGVTTDLGGYLAATYCRGVPAVMIPTSILCMVDASIGGKTGVNVPYGKNLIGSFYQPKKILIDPLVLKSLPEDEFRHGTAEMIKHGLICDRPYFEYLEKECESILDLDMPILEKVIFESCIIKTQIVEENERDNGKRNLLNFGHTVAHALESLSNYTLAHGEAVAIGIITEAHMAVQLQHLNQQDFKRIIKILNYYKFPLRLPANFNIVTIAKMMNLDKKSLKGTPRFVMINGIGSALPFDNSYCTTVDDQIVMNSLLWVQDALCGR